MSTQTSLRERVRIVIDFLIVTASISKNAYQYYIKTEINRWTYKLSRHKDNHQSNDKGENFGLIMKEQNKVR